MAKKRRKKRKSSRQPQRSGCAVWLIPILLGVIILLTRSDVRDFVSRLVKMRSTGESTHSAGSSSTARQNNNTNPGSDKRAQQIRHANQRIRDLIRNNITPARDPRPVSSPKPASSSSADQTLRLYFVKYDEAKDLFKLVSVKRRAATATPAAKAAELLLAGPTPAELRRGYRTLIPAGSRMRSVKLQQQTLTVDMNSRFISGQKLGREGMVLQLYQVINTMCAFPSVKRVKFLINGRRRSTAGGDGVPLNRQFSYKATPLK